MDPQQKMVKTFHETFGITTNDKPTIPSWEDRVLRLKLIYEEFLELCEASGVYTDLPEKLNPITDGDVNLVEVADGLADLEYVIKGAGCTFGISVYPVFKEVHRSNMSKVGGHKNEDGKLIKPASYSPPDIRPILLEQGMEK